MFLSIFSFKFSAIISCFNRLWKDFLYKLPYFQQSYFRSLFSLFRGQTDIWIPFISALPQANSRTSYWELQGQLRGWLQIFLTRNWAKNFSIILLRWFKVHTDRPTCKAFRKNWIQIQKTEFLFFLLTPGVFQLTIRNRIILTNFLN